MRQSCITIFSLAATMYAVAAQESGPPAPPDKLIAFERLLGHWEGRGTAVLDAKQAAIPWESTSTVQRVLGNHFVQTESAIAFGEPAPGVLRTVSLIGWDRESKTFKQWHVSNTGEAGEVTLHWDGEDTYTSTNSRVVDDELVVERWSTTLAQNSHSIAGVRAVGAGDFDTHFAGTHRRVDSVPRTTSSKRGAFVADPPHARMQKLAQAAGQYIVDGKAAGGSLGAMVEVSLDQRVRPIFGGTVLGLYTFGVAPEEHLSYAAIAWSADDDCYRLVFADNRGVAGMARSRWVGTSLVTTMTGSTWNQPMAMRWVHECDARGAFTRVEAHRLSGIEESEIVFSGAYEKQ